MTFRYTSPRRPLDIGYAARAAGVEIDWDATDIGPSGRDDIEMETRIYAFKGPLPERVVDQMMLEVVED